MIAFLPYLQTLHLDVKSRRGQTLQLICTAYEWKINSFKTLKPGMNKWNVYLTSFIAEQNKLECLLLAHFLENFSIYR